MPNLNPRIFYNRVYRKTYPDEELDKRPFLNLGSGSKWQRKWWRTADRLYDGLSWASYQANKNVDKVFIDHLFNYEEETSLDIEDSSLHIVYCSHSLEHTHNQFVYHAIKEAYRCLKLGGTLRLVVPDASLFIEASDSNDHSFFPWLDPNKVVDPIEVISARSLGPIQHLLRDNLITKQEVVTGMRSDPFKFLEHVYELGTRYIGNTEGIHVNFFNYGKLRTILFKCGFSKIYKSSYLQSKCKFLRESTFDQTRPHQSLYVEAIK